METLSLPCANRSKENLLPLQAFTNKINEFKKLAQSAREELLRSAQVEKFCCDERYQAPFKFS